MRFSKPYKVSGNAGSQNVPLYLQPTLGSGTSWHLIPPAAWTGHFPQWGPWWNPPCTVTIRRQIRTPGGALPDDSRLHGWLKREKQLRASETLCLDADA